MSRVRTACARTRRLAPELHLRLLTALCGDALSCGPMRGLINEREASIAHMHTERQKEVRTTCLKPYILELGTGACRPRASYGAPRR